MSKSHGSLRSVPAPARAGSGEGDSHGLGLAGPTVAAADRALVARLLDGDEAAFEELVATLHGPMLRFVRVFLKRHDVAEEVVQETWLAVLHGLPAFEGRSSLKTWIFHILSNNTPEAIALRGEAMEQLEAALETLPAAQRTVVTLRDVEGWSALEFCNVLEISETNQRVLLHRARTRLRAKLGEVLGR